MIRFVRNTRRFNMNRYQYELTEKLSFVRYGGTAEEKRAAELLMNEIKSAGGDAEYMEFKIPAYELVKCTAKVLSPYEKELEVIPYGLSGELPEGGKTLKLIYAGRGIEDDYPHGADDLSDTAVLINELSFDAYKLLCKKNAAAFITISGMHFSTAETTDLTPRNLRPKMLENGKVPGFSIWAKDATELVRDGVDMIHLELRENEYEATSQNIIAEIKGTELPDETVVLTAHYDSVLVGTGSWDNATGSATIMYLYRHFLKNPAKRTLRFIWCGSEEQGLLGSKAYVEKYADVVEKEVKFCFNFDMCGTILGNNQIFVTGGDDLKHYAEQFAREYGITADVSVLVHSSDSAPFCDKGVPALGLSRGTRTATIHTRNDVMFPLSAEQLKRDGDFAVAFVSRLANSARLPVGLGMPDNMKESLNKYFQRDKVSYKKEESKSE